MPPVLHSVPTLLLYLFMDVVVFDGEGGCGVQVNNAFGAFLQTNRVLLHVLHKQGKSVKHTFFFQLFCMSFEVQCSLF